MKNFVLMKPCLHTLLYVLYMSMCVLLTVIVNDLQLLIIIAKEVILHDVEMFLAFCSSVPSSPCCCLWANTLLLYYTTVFRKIGGSYKTQLRCRQVSHLVVVNQMHAVSLANFVISCWSSLFTCYQGETTEWLLSTVIYITRKPS